MLPGDALLATRWLIFKSVHLRTLFRGPSGCSLTGELLLARSLKPQGFQSDECQGQPTGTLLSVELTLNASMGTEAGVVSARLRSLLRSSKIYILNAEIFLCPCGFSAREKEQNWSCLPKAFPGFLFVLTVFSSWAAKDGNCIPLFLKNTSGVDRSLPGLDRI